MADGGVPLDSGSDVILDFICENCINDGKEVEAQGYCEDCSEYLCDMCYNNHRRTLFTSHHVLQTKASMPKDKRSPSEIERRGTAKFSRSSRLSKHIDVYQTSSSSKLLVTKLGGINVKTIDDKHTSFITGLAVLLDKLLIADSHNNKLKLIDTDTNKVLGVEQLTASPWDVARINDQLAVVTIPACKTILFIHVTDEIRKTSEITVRGECCGVAYSQRRLYVTFRDRPCLKILNLRGKTIQKIEKNGDGTNLFAMPWYICTSSDRDSLYISDSKFGSVISLSLDGEVKDVYKDNELVLPQKVCTDQQGNVYVCGYYTRNVHLLSRRLAKIGVLAKAGELLRGVRSICHCPDKNRLYIGVDSGVVKVYQLAVQ